MGSTSATVATSIRRSGKESMARGEWRRSRPTPTAYVGTRENFRGGANTVARPETVRISVSFTTVSAGKDSRASRAAPIIAPQEDPHCGSELWQYGLSKRYASIGRGNRV